MEFIEVIHKRALQAVFSFKVAEADLVSVFQALDESRAYLRMDHTSLFSYALSLGLSEDTINNLTAVSRKAAKLPVLQTAIQSGALTVSKARKITSVIVLENQEEWVSKALTLSTRKLEQEVARVNPREAVKESLKFVSEERLELKLGVSLELEGKIKRVQDLESQRTSRPVSLEEALQAAVDTYLERKDPLIKAERILNKSVNSPVTCQVDSGVDLKKNIPSYIKNNVMRRDGGRCAHRDHQGRRCSNRRWLDVHHVKPRVNGGDHSLENLMTLCSAHHGMEHAA
jgi:hypothetical protein